MGSDGALRSLGAKGSHRASDLTLLLFSAPHTLNTPQFSFLPVDVYIGSPEVLGYRWGVLIPHGRCCNKTESFVLTPV